MTTHAVDNSRDKLGRFVKGNTAGFQPHNNANPKGRPKNPFSITARQKEKLLEVCPFDPQGRTWIEALSEGGMMQALTIPTAMGNLLDRHEGKVTQPISGPDGGSIRFTMIFKEADDNNDSS